MTDGDSGLIVDAKDTVAKAVATVIRNRMFDTDLHQDENIVLIWWKK